MAGVRTMHVRAEPATRESFAAFGVLPSDEGDGAPTADLEFLLHDGWVNFIGHTIDEVTAGATGPICDHLNRHDTHTQTLMPFSCDAFVAVAPPAVDFSQPDHFDTVRAFVLRRYDVVHLFRGTWHWGPYPIGADSVRVFNIQGRGYPNDNTVARLVQHHQVAYEIDLGAAGDARG